MKKVLTALAISACLTNTTLAQEQLVVETPFVHDRSAVTIEGELTLSGEPAPIYKQVVGLLPTEWNLAFTQQYLAIAPISWKKGDQWTEVLDKWGESNNANIMIDGQRKQIVVSPEQDKRPPGVAFVYSGNELHQELYEPAKRYQEAQQYVFNRLRKLQGTLHDSVTLHEAQARLFDLMHEVDKKQAEKARVAAIQEKEEKKQAERQKAKPKVKGPVTFYPDGTVKVVMKDDFLKPQIAEMLMAGERVKNHESLLWNASTNHRWPNTYQLKAESFDHALSKLLETYGLKINFKGNDIAIIDYK